MSKYLFLGKRYDLVHGFNSVKSPEIFNQSKYSNLHAHSNAICYLSTLAHLAAVFGTFPRVTLVCHRRGTEKGFTTRIRI